MRCSKPIWLKNGYRLRKAGCFAFRTNTGEKYNIHDRIKVYVINVKKTNKNPQIYVSRTHPGLVKRLLELEVPEIADGTVEIKTIAREAGSRTKISIFSRNENVDPVGACVGQRGGRIRAIVDELRGEMIDVIKWSQSDEEYIAASLSPAKVLQVDLDEENKVARVVVPDFQLSLAIGKEGQNARLAAKLTGWKIDIKSESQLRNQIESQLFNLDSISYEDDEYEADLDEVTEVSGDTEPEQEYNAEEDLDAAEEKNYDQEADAVEDTDVPDEEISEQETEAEIEPEKFNDNLEPFKGLDYENKKIPMRRCVDAGKKDKRELLRIVKNNEGEIFVIPPEKKGHGAYICKA